MAIAVAPVTGSVKDIGLNSTTPNALRLKFVLDSEASIGSVLIPTIPVYVEPADTDSFTIGLLPTDQMDGDHWYVISSQWLDPDAGWSPTNYFEYQVRVPTGGGGLDVLLDSPLAPAQTWWVPGGEIPDRARAGDTLFDPSSDLFSLLG